MYNRLLLFAPFRVGANPSARALFHFSGCAVAARALMQATPDDRFDKTAVPARPLR